MVQITNYSCPKHKLVKLEKHNAGFWCMQCERYWIKVKGQLVDKMRHKYE